MLRILVRGGRPIAEGPRIRIRHRNYQQFQLIQLHGDGLGRIGDTINLKPIKVVGCRVGEAIGQPLKARREHLVGAKVQGQPRNAAIVRAEDPPVGWVAFRVAGGVVGRCNGVLGDHVALAIRVLVINPALPRIRIIIGKIQPLGTGGIVKSIGGDFPEAVDAVIFTGSSHSPQMVVCRVNRGHGASVATGLGTELDGQRCDAVRRSGQGGRYQRRPTDGEAYRPDITDAIVIPGDIDTTAGRGSELTIPAPLLGGVGVGDRLRERGWIGELSVGDDGDFAFAGGFISIRQIEPAVRIQDAMGINDLAHPSPAAQAEDAALRGGRCHLATCYTRCRCWIRGRFRWPHNCQWRG